MNLSQKIYLFLSISICLTGCNAEYKCANLATAGDFAYTPVIHFADNSPVLFSSEFEIMKYRFSGLIAFRQMPEINEIRIVFLSETGLKLMEYKYFQGEISNTYCIAVADKKQIKKFIGNFLLLLIENPACNDICVETTNEKSIYFCKSQRIKLEAEIKNNQKIKTCYTKKNNRVCGTFTDSEELPDNIVVSMSHKKISINLTRVDNAFK
jgi:hypothetical protein